MSMKMLRRSIWVWAMIAFCGASAYAQAGAGQTAVQGVIAPAENLIVDGIPKIPAALAETAGRYGSYRSASLADWHPARREMLISTRFAETPQLHLVKAPGGARQ